MSAQSAVALAALSMSVFSGEANLGRPDTQSDQRGHREAPSSLPAESDGTVRGAQTHLRPPGAPAPHFHLMSSRPSCPFSTDPELVLKMKPQFEDWICEQNYANAASRDLELAVSPLWCHTTMLLVGPNNLNGKCIDGVFKSSVKMKFVLFLCYNDVTDRLLMSCRFDVCSVIKRLRDEVVR